MKSKTVMVFEIIDDLRRIHQVLTERSKRVEHETGLTSTQVWVMRLLSESSPIKVSDLARRMYLHPATMVGLIDRLEAKGMVRRTRSETDRRVVHIDLTDTGHSLVKRSPEAVQELLVTGLEHLADPKLKKTSESLQMIVKILGAQEEQPRLIMSSDVNAPGGEKPAENGELLVPVGQ